MCIRDRFNAQLKFYNAQSHLSKSISDIANSTNFIATSFGAFSLIQFYIFYIGKLLYSYNSLFTYQFNYYYCGLTYIAFYQKLFGIQKLLGIQFYCKLLAGIQFYQKLLLGIQFYYKLLLGIQFYYFQLLAYQLVGYPNYVYQNYLKQF
eukprot:TRINITY_DN1446_c0_g1_i3.p3 TRINITY_DN1446_c0_g1~~TRINITY_DN1446_c0_g1_i3.p3  ORF type:complete len:149 (+),score=1.90 TRINITY_DN1446_c0_g1_i3:63-509(+)